MVRAQFAWVVVVVLLLSVGGVLAAEADNATKPLQPSGIYPHLAVFNGTGSECGIGAVVPWADRLWLITYPPHATQGSTDKLYEIDSRMNQVIRPESVGGTHACRMIHRESNQLIIGPYFIDAKRNVRAADLRKLRGRMTAVARHLVDPAKLVYFFDMEGAIYEVDVHTLEVKLLFEKPVPGWHGKGGYTSQGRLVIANNGEAAVGKKKYDFLADWDASDREAAGALAEWDGKTWRVVERRPFTDVTGPGSIHGAPDDQSPLWSIGWDRRSVILKLLDAGRWQTFRLPKASHCFDPFHGWYTEWPRIREIAPGRMMMVMHGMMYDFPPGFSAADTGGIRPICSHLRYVTDFCNWNGRLVISSDDASIMKNPMAGQSQSNMWFGDPDALKQWGPRSGWGGPWVEDAVKAGEPSAPFLVGGFQRRCLHLAIGRGTPHAGAEVTFTVEIDARGDGKWAEFQKIPVPANGYRWHVFPADCQAQWVRVKADRDCVATAYFHCTSAWQQPPEAASIFRALADVADASVCGGLVRPAGHNRNLQWVDSVGQVANLPPRATVAACTGTSEAGTGQVGNLPHDAVYREVDERLQFHAPKESRVDEVQKIAEVARDFEVDAASVVMTHKGRRYRLPKGDARYDAAFPTGWPRGIREVASERYLANIHGAFYEIPRDDGLPLVKPVASHGRQIMDFCTWRGLLVLSGTKPGAKPDGNYFPAGDGRGLWFGGVDDLWRLGKPTGRGGPWRETAAEPGKPSDPYLMTNYDRKSVRLSHDAADEVTFTIEVDFDHRGWWPYETVKAPAGKSVTHEFPAGYGAHWVRFRVDRPCRATAQLAYE